MKIFKQNKAELTTQQIVLLIILIASFLIILLFFFRLNLGEETQKEICHNSVVLKGKAGFSGGSLDCRTNYVCISGGKECEGITPTETIKVNMNPNPTTKKTKEDLIKDQVLKSIAEEMADCWWQFGEGKVDYIGLDVEGATIGNVNCAVCSIIKFDERIKDNTEETTISNLYNYLALTKKDNSQTYLYYLTKKNTYDGEIPSFSEKIDFSEKYVVVTGITKLNALKSIANFAGISLDSFNDVFFSFWPVSKTPKYEDYGPFPATIVKQSEIRSKIGCDNFITKA